MAGAVLTMVNHAQNGNHIPDHMNVLTITEAYEQLERTTWRADELKDMSMLPLGISPAMLNGGGAS
jgi:hypothetical protein